MKHAVIALVIAIALVFKKRSITMIQMRNLMCQLFPKLDLPCSFRILEICEIIWKPFPKTSLVWNEKLLFNSFSKISYLNWLLNSLNKQMIHKCMKPWMSHLGKQIVETSVVRMNVVILEDLSHYRKVSLISQICSILI